MAKKQPWGITLATILLLVGGVLTLLGALTSLFLGTILGLSFGLAGDVSGYAGMLMIFMAMIYIAISIAYLAVAYFLWNHETWAWWVALILAVLGLVMGLPTIFTIMGILMLVLTIFVVIGLLQKDSKRVCKVKF